MQSDIIIDKYWDIFLSHICEYHPIDKDFINKYSAELDWISLSKNKAIKWDKDFIEKYQEELIWHEIAWNDAICWTSDMIDKFKKRLDWYYLSRNKNLPITEEFIKKYSKKLFVIENNPLLTKELIKEFNLKTLPAINHEKQELKVVTLFEVEKILSNCNYYHNQKTLYSDILLPIINTQGLFEIFNNKFDYSQRYYYLDAIKDDINGLTPEYIVEGEDPFSEYVRGREILDIDYTVKLKFGPLQEGPDRLYEVPRFSGISYYATLLVSENVKNVLENFKLPKHKFHPVTLTPKKITTETKFYILQLDHDTLTKNLQYKKVHFNYISGRKGKRSYGTLTTNIQSFEDLENLKEIYRKSDDKTLKNAEILPNAFLLSSDFDIHSFSYQGKIIVNQIVKNKLEEMFPKQMSFKSAQLLKIKIDQETYDKKKDYTIKDEGNFTKVVYTESSMDKYFYEKLARLDNADAPIPVELLQNNEFPNKERELNVIFPLSFKESIRNKNLKIKDYNLLPISDFYTQNEYSDRFPETYKSVAIAENGLGDSINLLLEKDSDYKLGIKLYEFFHETGEVEQMQQLRLTRVSR